MKINKLENYEIIDTLYEGNNAMVYRARHTNTQQSIVVKMLPKEYPLPSELARFQHESKLLERIDSERVIKTLGIGKYQNTIFIRLEDCGGQALTQWLKPLSLTGGVQPFSLQDFLKLAIEISHALAEIHAAKIIHKDINLSNIIWNPDRQQLKIIDFGIASHLPQEYLSLQNPEQLEGTLAYLSPEQTGRINRVVDYRSDLYSLGVTFYELLTGRLPFTATDAMELVHCHIAEPPIPVCQVDAGVPPVLSGIIMKLLEKNAENRYQSAFGLKADLARCLATNCQRFTLAENDYSGRFQIPQKLYGRDAEIEALVQAFDRVSHGSCEMMLIAGFSGVGKTALVREVYKPMTEKKAYFSAGKFDQFQRNIPYFGLFQALDSLCDYFLSESSEHIHRLRSLILNAVGDNGKVLTDVVPKLELIIGKQTAVANVAEMDAQNRFNLVFQNFFKAISRPEHPFILFIDDLQWADTSSLNLLKSLMRDTECRYLLIIGAYRENEVDEVHEVSLLMNQLYKERAALTKVSLPNLLFSEVNTLVSESLISSLEFSQPLTQLVYEKTQGNAFFVHEFLKSLYQKGFLSFNAKLHEWQWNVAEISSLNLTGNVTHLMVAKLTTLTASTQAVLKLSACIGNRFDLKMLSLLCGESPENTLKNLWESIENGLIHPLDEKYKELEHQDTNVNPLFCFQHDRVQQAAYSLLEESEKPGLHYKIGYSLLATPESFDERLFETVDHLNLGITLVADPNEKIRIAKLNLQSGQKAKATIAYQAALDYFRQGIALLPTDCWRKYYPLSLALYEEATSAAALNGDYENMEKWSSTVFEQATMVLDQVKTLETKIQAYSAQNKLAEAVKTGLQALRLLGRKLPDNPSMRDIQQGYAEIMEMLPRPNVRTLLQLPEMRDLQVLAIIRIIASIVPASFQSKPTLFPILAFEEVKLSIQHGNGAFSACAYGDFGMLLVGMFNDVELGYQFGRIAVELAEQLNSKTTKPPALFKSTAFTFYGKHAIRESLPLFLKTYQAGMDVGDLLHAGFSASFQSVYGYFAGVELS